MALTAVAMAFSILSCVADSSLTVPFDGQSHKVLLGGPLQEFRFEAAESGVAVIHFRQIFQDRVSYTVEDTIVVER